VHNGVATSVGRFNEGGTYVVFERKAPIRDAQAATASQPVSSTGQYQMELSDGMDY